MGENNALRVPESTRNQDIFVDSTFGGGLGD